MSPPDRAATGSLRVIAVGGSPCLSRQHGATLLEVGLALAILAAVAAGAMTLGQSWSRGLEPVREAARASLRVEALRYAVNDWYRVRYCSPDRTEALAFPLYGAVAETECLAECRAADAECAKQCEVARYVAPHLKRLILADAPEVHGTFRWKIVSRWDEDKTIYPPPRLRLFWDPPARLDGQAMALAGELDVFCAGADDARDPCDTANTLVWDAPLGVSSENRALRQRRLREWLASNAIDCDADGDSIMDRFCDGTKADGLLDPVIDADGDGCDDTRLPDAAGDGCYGSALLDLNGDGRLDWDANDDLVVDAVDFQAFGC